MDGRPPAAGAPDAFIVGERFITGGFASLLCSYGTPAYIISSFIIDSPTRFGIDACPGVSVTVTGYHSIDSTRRGHLREAKDKFIVAAIQNLHFISHKG